MRQYPIWNVVHGQGKKSSADFGSDGAFTQLVFVGSGSRNSHTLGEVRVVRQVDAQGRHHFRLMVDGETIKHGVYEPSTGEYIPQELN